MQRTNRSTFETLEGRTLFSAGNLDPSFGTGGLTTMNIGNSDSASAVLVTPTGKTLVAGTSGSDFVLARFRKNGTPDTSFGGGDGHVETDLGGYETGAALAYDHSTGRIVVAGSSYSQYGGTKYAVAVYRVDGTLDKSFNGTGKKVFGFDVDTFFGDVSDEGCYANGVALRNGKILLTGTVRYKVPNYEDATDSAFGLARLKADGSFDSSFKDGGRTTFEFWHNQPYDFQEATCLKVLSDGKFLVGGRSNDYMGIAKFKADGNYDSGFGNGGVTSIDMGPGFEMIRSIDVRTTGDIAVAGDATKNGKSAWGIAMLRPDGKLQNSFSGDGKYVLTLGGTVTQVPTAIRFQPEGRLVVVGTGSLFSNKSDFSAVRIGPSGNIDDTFGTGLNGYAWVDFGGTNDSPAAVDIGADGRIVIAGTKTFADGKSDLALSRHIGKPTIVSIKATDAVAVEGSSNIGKIRLLRYNNLEESLTVKISITGTAGSADYGLNKTLPITFAPGQSEIYIEVKAKADNKVEATETVKFTVLPDTFYMEGGDATVTIEDAN